MPEEPRTSDQRQLGDKVAAATAKHMERTSMSAKAKRRRERATTEESRRASQQTTYENTYQLSTCSERGEAGKGALQRPLLISPSREPELETTAEDPRFENQNSGEQTVDPFLHHLYKILDMLLDATPQLAAKKEDPRVDLDSRYWDGAETDGDGVSLGLGDVVDDITYAPRPEALRLRLFWTGARETGTGLALQRRPQSWTPANFNRYMRRLVIVARERQKDGQDVSGTSAATREITSLVTDENILPYLHPYTLDVALDHLYKQRCFEDMLRVFYLLKQRSFAFNAPNFSRFVLVATWYENHMDLLPILEHMLDCGFRPTGHTWFSFYQLVSRKYPSKRRLVLRAMHKKGLTSNGAPNVKDALVRSLGWIEDSKLIPTSPRREPKLEDNNSGPLPDSK